MKIPAARTILLATAAALAAPSTQAAVTVLGNGVAHSCYQFAEYGGNPTDGINTCSFALEQGSNGPCLAIQLAIGQTSFFSFPLP